MQAVLYYNCFVNETNERGECMYNEIVDLINSTVFPIAMCIIMLTQNNKTTAELKKSIDNNTLTITKLCEKIDKS